MRYLDVDIDDRKYRLCGEAKEAFLKALKRQLLKKELAEARAELRDLQREIRALRRERRSRAPRDTEAAQQNGDGDDGAISRAPHYFDDNGGWIGR